MAETLLFWLQHDGQPRWTQEISGRARLRPLRVSGFHLPQTAPQNTAKTLAMYGCVAMTSLMLKSFCNADFDPHGFCYLWDKNLVWLHVISDSTIALAYFAIPMVLLWFIRQRWDLPFSWMFVLHATSDQLQSFLHSHNSHPRENSGLPTSLSGSPLPSTSKAASFTYKYRSSKSNKMCTSSILSSSPCAHKVQAYLRALNPTFFGL